MIVVEGHGAIDHQLAQGGRDQVGRFEKGDETQAVDAELALLLLEVNAQSIPARRQIDHGRCFEAIQPVQGHADRLRLEADSAQFSLERLGLRAGAEVCDSSRTGRRGCRSSEGFSGLGNPLIAAARQTGDLTIQFQVQQHHRNHVGRQAATAGELVHAAGIETHAWQQSAGFFAARRGDRGGCAGPCCQRSSSSTSSDRFDQLGPLLDQLVAAP
jgi:hypothetical protein